MQKDKSYKVIGMMSGTSLDGVDLTCAIYKYSAGKWSFQLQAAKTYPYAKDIIQSINVMQNIHTTFLVFKAEEIKYSQYISQLILTFINQFKLTNVDFLSLHGHTIFHHTKEKITVQITNLNTIAGITHINTIGNFRQLDVMRGGQGAPLAPFGEELFEGDIFINFGGVANIGCCGQGWDIIYCNLFLNHFASIIADKEYDQGGQQGRKGAFRKEIFQYFTIFWKSQKKLSLQREIFEDLLQKLLKTFAQQQKKDILASYYHFMATKIAQSISQIKQKCKQTLTSQDVKVLCTGGGAHNTFLIQLLKQKVSSNFSIVVPSSSFIEFKEAIIFGFLGVKYIENISNCAQGIGGMLVKGK